MELTLFLDHACNLRCDYCYGGRKFTRRMPSAVMKQAVDLALAERPSLFEVSFFGGEPLLHPDLIEETLAYVESASARQGLGPGQVRFIMNSNGTLISERALAILAPPRRWTTFVSLDGPAAVHNARRVDAQGAGTFDTVVANLARLRDRRIPFCLVAVVTPQEARSLGAVVRTLCEQQPELIMLSPELHAEWNEDAIAGLRAGLADVNELWMREFRCGHVVCIEPLHNKILTHIYEGIPCPERCTLAGRAFAVAPSGRLYACAQIIGEDSRDDLVIGTVDTGLDRQRLAEMQRQKDRVEETCGPCALRLRCQSHCGCRHLALTGDLGHITSTLCDIEESFILAADQMASALYAEECPSFMDTYYRQRYHAPVGATLTRLRRPSES